MDTLTHGLLGAAIGAIPWPRRFVRDESTQATRAGVLAAVLAAELPDIDYLLPAGDAVLHALTAHRGLTHSLLGIPIVAAVAAALAKLVFRRSRVPPLYFRALLAVPLAHLLPDLWTGWGTRLFLPFSERRLALDWTMVLDPFFTLPLVVGAGCALWQRASWRRIYAIGAGVSASYLAFRIATAHQLEGVVRAAYPGAMSVHVFPAPLTLTRWRYVARFQGEHAAGSVALGSGAVEEARVSAFPTGPVPPRLAAVHTVREAMAWARFPLVRVGAATTSGQRIEVADLRYHLRGKPTLTFVIDVTRDGSVGEARLERNVGIRDVIR